MEQQVASYMDTLSNMLLQLEIYKSMLFLKSATLEVRTIHFIPFIFTLLVTVRQKQPKQ